MRPSPSKDDAMPVQIRSSGCLFSIIASIVLTVVLNLVLRSCGAGPGV
jgi:hypothetical protein